MSAAVEVLKSTVIRLSIMDCAECNAKGRPNCMDIMAYDEIAEHLAQALDEAGLLA